MLESPYLQVVAVSQLDRLLRAAVDHHAVPLELPVSFPVNLTDLEAESAQLVRQFGYGRPQLWKTQSFHDGGWRTLKLWSFGGDLDDDEPHGDNKIGGTGAETDAVRWGPTRAWHALPRGGFIRSVLEPLAPLLRRVRLSTMLPGAMVYYHDDQGKFDRIARVHMPLTKKAGAELLLGGHLGSFKPGTCCIADFNVPHTLWNFGTEPRTTLLVDVQNVPGRLIASGPLGREIVATLAQVNDFAQQDRRERLWDLTRKGLQSLWHYTGGNAMHFRGAERALRLAGGNVTVATSLLEAQRADSNA